MECYDCPMKHIADINGRDVYYCNVQCVPDGYYTLEAMNEGCPKDNFIVIPDTCSDCDIFFHPGYPDFCYFYHKKIDENDTDTFLEKPKWCKAKSVFVLE